MAEERCCGTCEHWHRRKPQRFGNCWFEVKCRIPSCFDGPHVMLPEGGRDCPCRQPRKESE